MIVRVWNRLIGLFHWIPRLTNNTKHFMSVLGLEIHKHQINADVYTICLYFSSKSFLEMEQKSSSHCLRPNLIKMCSLNVLGCLHWHFANSLNKSRRNCVSVSKIRKKGSFTSGTLVYITEILETESQCFNTVWKHSINNTLSTD